MGNDRFLNQIFRIFLVLNHFWPGSRSGSESKFGLDPDPQHCLTLKKQGKFKAIPASNNKKNRWRYLLKEGEVCGYL